MGGGGGEGEEGRVGRYILNKPGPPTRASKYSMNAKPFSYGTEEKASSGFTPLNLGMRAVSGWSLPK